MIVYASSVYYQRFAPLLISAHPGIVAGVAAMERFGNGEMHALIKDPVKDELCLVIGTIAPPDEQLLRLLTLTNSLKRNGARHIRVFLPYLGYARQDKFATGESGGIALMGALMKAAGVNEIIGVDVHSNLDRQLIGLPLVSLSSAQLFAPIIRSLNLHDVPVVAPDTGAIPRAHMLAAELGNVRPITYLTKRRADGISHEEVIGKVGRNVVLVDDIIDSGSTLISACKLLQDHGVKEITAFVTHGLFTDEAWDQIFRLGVKALYVTDSCPEAMRQQPKVHIVSLAPLLPLVVHRIARKEVQYEYAIA